MKTHQVIHTTAVVAIICMTLLIVPTLLVRRQFSRHIDPKLEAKGNYANQMFKEGHWAFAHGKYKIAEPLLLKSVELGPSLGILAYRDLSAIYKEEGRTEEAFEAHQRAYGPSSMGVSTFPNDVATLAEYGIECDQKGQWSEAVRVYNQARDRLNPAPPVWPDVSFTPHVRQSSRLRAMLCVVRGISLGESNKLTGELASYREAVRLAPDEAVTQFYLGYALQKMGHMTEARVAFQKATQVGTGPVKTAAQQALVDGRSAQDQSQTT